jgi:hypothetical protein
MSVHAGSILTVGGNNVIDRIQSAGLGDATVPVETIREVGNKLVVDKIPGEPDFTFSLESLDVSTDIMALLTGKTGALAEPGGAPGAADAVGTEYKWLDCGYINIASPWKDALNDAAGDIVAGHLVPAYYPTRVRYAFGVTDFATQTVDLGGGAFYYAKAAPVEEYGVADGVITAFITADPTIEHRLGGAAGTTFRNVFGVIVGGVPMIEGVDFTVTGGNGTPATITFAVAPAATDLVRYAYFTDAPKAYPQPVHAATIVKPGAVRGRNIVVLRGTDPDARPADEFEELERHLASYNAAVEARRVELEEPVRASLGQLSMGELVEQVREDRVSAEASSAFMATYSRWSWLAGTYTSNAPVGRKRSFSDMEQLEEAAPEVLEALRETFQELETSLQRGPQGN